ncbi:MAG: hypothetical protein L0214_07555 [candidate division NC10 bacterium]|nr:hypothetical protein [candidate division NC10 bacterium]
MAKRRRRRNPGIPEEVWSAAGWFSGSEPFMAMIFDPARFTKERAGKKFLAHLNREARDMWRGGDYGVTLREFMDDLAWSGVHMMRLNDALSPIPSERAEALDDLQRLGYAYPGTAY